MDHQPYPVINGVHQIQQKMLMAEKIRLPILRIIILEHYEVILMIENRLLKMVIMAEVEMMEMAIWCNH